MRRKTEEIEKDEIFEAIEACKLWLSLTLSNLGVKDEGVGTECLRLWTAFPFIPAVHDICSGDLSLMVQYIFNRERENDPWNRFLVQLERDMRQDQQTFGMSYGFRQELV